MEVTCLSGPTFLRSVNWGDIAPIIPCPMPSCLAEGVRPALASLRKAISSVRWRASGMPANVARDTRLGRAPVLDEKQRTARSQHTSHLGERPGRIWNCAQGPSRDDGINAPAVERHRLC